MKKVVIFGAGDLGKILYARIKDTYEVLFMVDNNYTDAVSPSNDLRVLPPSVLTETDFDLIYIASVNGLESICEQLTKKHNVPADKINRFFGEYWKKESSDMKNASKPRIDFLNNYAHYLYEQNIEGNIAEVGVFHGDFAKEINRAFPDRKLYLFDTFEGFSEHDLQIEAEKNLSYDLLYDYLKKEAGFFKRNSVDFVLNKLPYPEKCVIKKGFFPETFDLQKETFAFVNLDVDLYQPIKAGLEIFYPLISKGGVILVHDYFGNCLGVTKAVNEFVAKSKVAALPIGDGLSIAIIKS